MIHDRIVIPRRISTLRVRCTLVAALVLFAPILNLVPAIASASDTPAIRYYTASTGHTIGDSFLQRWIDENGAVTLGNPISELIKANGKTLQYFQYGVLSGSKSGANVSRLPAAGMLLAMRTQANSPASARRSSGLLDARAGSTVSSDPQKKNIEWNPKTKHTIAGDILAYYEKHDGANEFGQPLTEAYVFGGVTEQWFDYGRIQVDARTGKVSTGSIGFELAHAEGISARKVSRGGLPLFVASRFAKFSGDGTIPEAAGVFEPVEIIIPAISVDAKIEQVAIVNGAMGTPQNAWNVGWYPQLSWPGEYTNVVMAGHRDWWGIGPTVFYNLPSLAPGEMIYLVGSDGKGATYQITDTYSVGSGANASDVVGDTGTDMLTLITCDGSFDGAEYASRQIIRAARI